jgi:hypothetical protein
MHVQHSNIFERRYSQVSIFSDFDILSFRYLGIAISHSNGVKMLEDDENRVLEMRGLRVFE